MKSIPPLYSLRAFEMAARKNSFTKAADQLNLTQSAISQHVKNLESFYDKKLFYRHKGKLELTPFGVEKYAELSKAFLIIENMHRASKAPDSHLKIKTPTSLTNRFLIKRVNAYNLREAPKKIEISSHWMEVDTIDFASENFDAAIVLSDGKFPDNCFCQHLFPEWLIPINDSYEGIDISQVRDLLRTLEMIHSSQDKSDWGMWAAKTIGVDELNLDRGMTFDTIDQGMTAAQHGVGVAIGDLTMISEEINSGRAKPLANIAVHSGKDYYLVSPRYSAEAEFIHDFGEFLRSNIPCLIDNDLQYIR